MNEQSLLTLLAKLCGDITVAGNTDAAQIFKLQEAVATSLINDPGLKAADRFNFEDTEDFSTQKLDAADLQHLSDVLQRVQKKTQVIDQTIRVFRRETPFRSSQVRGSVPEWGRGGEIIETIGPMFNRDGRRFWFDLYRIIPVVQIWLQGAARPFMLLPIQVRTLIIGSGAPKKFEIPKGSVWIHADVFAATSPDNHYCGLLVKGGQLNLTAGLDLTADNKIIIPVGNTASVALNLEQKPVTDASPDSYGIDAKEAGIELPKSFSFTINHNGRTLKAESAKWNLYGQPIAFTHDAAQQPIWNGLMNRIAVPFNADAEAFDVRQCKSLFCTVNGKAKIADSAWVLSAAAINIAAPVEAEGIGAMAIRTLHGLHATWAGLKDSNLSEPGDTSFKNAVVMLAPGRINIATLFAANPLGKQRFRLWNEPPPSADAAPVLQTLDLSYTKQHYFFYDSLQAGTETVITQANCVVAISKPVQVDGRPFKVESLQTMVGISMSKATQTLMLYDENMIADNWAKTAPPVTPSVPPPPVSFLPSAMALNNALLTVSPVNSMLLYADLKSEDSFDKAALVLSFGLLQYLPTLPDPYAANVSFFKRRGRGKEEGRSLLSEIVSLVLCMMRWKDLDVPEVTFFAGDQPPPKSTTNTTVQPGTTVRLDSLKNTENIRQVNSTRVGRINTLKSHSWASASDDAQTVNSQLETENRMMIAATEKISGGGRSPFRNAFALLDVSTNADLMGISVGPASDEWIFKITGVAQEQVAGNPISIQGLDVHAVSRMVQLYALPQISWEPMINLSDYVNVNEDPHPGVLYFLNDGEPMQMASVSSKPVNLAPIPLTRQFVKDDYNGPGKKPLWSYFTLSNGMLALGIYHGSGSQRPQVDLIEENFEDEVSTGLQIKTLGYHDDIIEAKKIPGSAHQLKNINNFFAPATNNRSVLSGSVTFIFNNEFSSQVGFDPEKYIPLERYDFTGYGANVFSHWVNKTAALAQTSQAMFDVWRGRTAHEVIQVKSVIYPWAIRVVRTITIYRGSNGYPWRTDSGWKAESDGIYDFRTRIEDHPSDTQDLLGAKISERARAYRFHPGMVEGVYNVRNIKEDTTLAPFTKTWNKTTGVYINEQGHPKAAPAPQPLEVKLVPVYFDADVEIDDATQGAVDGKVASQRMLGYLQLSPRGVFIEQEDFASLLTMMQGLGGPVDCTLDINGGGQLMRVTRVEVNPSRDAANNRVFVTAAKGTPVLPKDGSWSLVEHDAVSKEVLPLKGNNTVPAVRTGERKFPDDKKSSYTQDKGAAVHIAEATELFKALETRAKQYAFLQSTGENKILFRNPLFDKGADKDILKGSVPDFADAYRLLNSKGIFPKLEELPKIDRIGPDFVMKIQEAGYKLLNKVNPAALLEQALPKGPWYVVDTNDVKVYVKYESKSGAAAKLNLNIDSAANQWLNKMNDVAMYVDLASFKELLVIRGKFDTAKGKSPKFVEPVMEFGPDLKPIYDILVVLSQLAVNPDYKDLLANGLKIFMSNSPNNWEYKFKADKEIPIIKFPSDVMDSPAAPLRLEASLIAGVYFNLPIPLPPTGGIQAPSAGAYMEFYGKLSVMCVSLAAATIYAVGQATVRISADTVTGPALYLKFGFGVEIMVGLPVIGSVSLYYAVGVEVSLDSTQITVGAFLLFRGRASILGGIVTVTILIEASGSVQDRSGTDAMDENGATTMIAQVTFSLDVSVCFVIDLSFTERWREERQIA